MIKRLRWIGAILILIALIILSILYVFGNQIFKAQLEKYVAQKSNGVYHLEYKDLSINLLNGDLKIEGFNLKFDSIKADSIIKKDSTQHFFNVRVKELSATGLKIMQLWRNQNLNIRDLSLVNPRIFAYGEKREQKPNKKSGEFIQQLFNNVDIEQIAIKNASYDIYANLIKNSKLSNAKRIDILVKNFHSDPDLFAQKTYFSIKDLSIRFIGFENDLNDNIHTFKADTLNFSLNNGLLKASNILVFPKNIIPGKDYFKLSVPTFSISVKNKDINHFDELEFGTINLENVGVSYYQVPKKAEIKALKRIDLYELIKKDFKEISIDELNINNAKIENFTIVGTQKIPSQQIEKLNFQLQNFKIDSLSSTNENKLFYADAFVLQIEQFQQKLKDQNNQVNIKKVLIDSDKKLIDVTGIELKSNHQKKDEELNFAVDKITFNGLDMKQWYNQKAISVNTLAINNARYSDVIYKKEPLVLKQENKTQQTAKIWKVITSIFNHVEVKKVQLNNTKIAVDDYHIPNRIGFLHAVADVELTDLAVDVNPDVLERKHALFFSKNYKFTLKNVAFTAPNDANTYTAQSIKLDNQSKSIELQNFKIFPEKNAMTTLDKYNIATLMNFEAANIVLKNIDLEQLVFQREFKADLLQLRNPMIDLSSYASNQKKDAKKTLDEARMQAIFEKILNYSPQVSIAKIEIIGGKTLLKNTNLAGKRTSFNNSFSLVFDNFNFNKIAIDKGMEEHLFSDDVRYHAADEELDLGDNIHSIKVKEVNLSAKTRMLVSTDVHLSPKKNPEQYPDAKALYDIYIPQVRVHFIDMNKFLSSQVIDVDSLVLTNALINLNSKKTVPSKTFDFKNIQIPLIKNTSGLTLHHLVLDNCKMMTYQFVETPMDKRLVTQFTLNSSLTNFQNFKTAKGTDFLVGNAEHRITDFSLPLPHNGTLHLDQLQWNLMQGWMNIHAVRIKQNSGLAIEIPAIKVTDLDAQELKDNNLKASLLSFERPIVTIPKQMSNSNAKEQLPDLDTISFYQVIKPYLNALRIRKTQLVGGTVIMPDFSQNNIGMELDDLWIDEQTRENRVLYANNIYLKIKDLHQKKGHYNFDATELLYDFKKQYLTAAKVRINPDYSKVNYTKVLQVRTDRMEAKIGNIAVEQFSLRDYLLYKRLNLNKVTLDALILELYKDDSLNRNTNPKPLIGTILQQLKLPINLRSMVLKNSEIHILEMTHKTPAGLEVFLNNIQGIGTNITNQKEAVNRDKMMIFNIKADFMKQGKMSLNATFDLSSTTDEGTLSGELKNMQMEALNPILKDAAGVVITKGMLHDLSFEMKLDNEASLGTFSMNYDGLSVGVLNLKKGEKEKKFLSFVANSLLTNSSSASKEIQEHNLIAYKRVKDRSFLNYWVFSILSGAKYSFGLKASQQEILKDKAKSLR